MIALILAILGLYGRRSHSVARRAGEIGGNMALGALPRRMQGMIIRESLSIVLVSAVGGIAAAYAFYQVIAAMLDGLSPSRSPYLRHGCRLDPGGRPSRVLVASPPRDPRPPRRRVTLRINETGSCHRRGNPERPSHAHLHRKTWTGDALGRGHFGVAVKPFGYGSDPLCLIAMGLYALNRWGIKTAVDSPFLHDHFNDLLLIPAALPLVLWVQRKLNWRLHDRFPDAKEIGLHLIVWSLIAEVAGPHLFDHATGDWRDLVAYIVGAILAGLWWRFTAVGRKARPT